ncbi:MAG TPA: ZIP family zinc transporter [Anaerolineae bacterium]|nr:ZIP family zinc transporter [Anaerolineae bacterium]HXW00533.1 ZIP family zinc transporter [Anaerolineae bacterium]
MIEAALWGLLAAASLLIGYMLAGRELSNRITGMIMGFGAGALISAIAYELVPESMLGGEGMAVAFGLGALTFFGGDWLIDRQGGAERKNISGDQAGGSGGAIFIGTLLDNIPESIVLGMGVALGGSISLAFLVAVFVSNLPEGVAGTMNLEMAGHSRALIFWMWTTLVLISGACAALGYAIVGWLPSVDGRRIQAFAAGAMLTMLADAMMPEAFEHGGKVVGLLTVLGFLMAAILAVME